MVNGLKEKILKGNVDLCAKCSMRMITNLALCSKCGKPVHGKCTKKKVFSTLVKLFVCKRCVEAVKRIVEPDEKLSFYDQVVLVRVFVTWWTS